MADVIRSEFPTSEDLYTIWPVRHNWSDSLTFSMEFKTDIIVSADGSEQRRAVRLLARFSLAMSIVMDWPSKRALEDAFTRRRATGENQIDGFVVPLDFLPLTMLEALAPMETDLHIINDIADPTEPPFWLASGQRVLLADRDEPWYRETRSLASVGDDVLSFVEATDGDFTRRSYIWPAYLAFVPLNQAMSLLSSRVGQASSIALEFHANDFQTIPETGDQFFVGTQEFFQPKPNWGGEAELDFLFPYFRTDYGYGRYATSYQIEFPSRVYKFEYVFESVEKAFEIMGFFQRHKGMCSQFFFSTWEDDIEVRAIQGGGSNIVVDGQRLGATYHGLPANTVFKRVMVQYVDGTFTHHKIESVDELPDTQSSVVRLQDTLPVGTHPSDIERVSWVLNGRFAVDRLDCEFMSAGVGRITLAIQSLHNAEL